MTTDPVREVAQAVLYEGYLLWPYRITALKNRHRWTIGGVYPPAHCHGEAGPDRSWLRVQCLLQAGPDVDLRVHLRFLQRVAREVRQGGAGGGTPVPELVAGGERYLPGEEATEREVEVEVSTLAGVARRPYRRVLDIPAGSHAEPVGDPPAGALLRSWQRLRGRVEVAAQPVAAGLYRVTVTVTNTTGCPDTARPEVLARTFVSAHSVLHSRRGEFVSLTDPPPRWRDHAAACHNTGTWPVLAGPPGDRHTVLSAPIILYDHPAVAPESPGDLFDATEIDQLLILNILSLTEQEQQEMRASDPRAREILDRCAGLSAEELGRLHGAVREQRSLREVDSG